jgi:uncharacterized membrane protein
MEEGLKCEIKKFTLIFAIAAAIIYTAFALTPVPSEVGSLYYKYAGYMLDFQMPYSDFSAEYPPLAMLWILIPGLFSFSELTYQIAFGVEVYLFLLAGLVCVYRIAGTYIEEPKRLCDLYIVLCIVMFDFIIDRYDIFPMVMCLAALYFVRTERLSLAWVMIAVGTMTKLYPALMAPVLIIYLCMNGRKMEALKGVGICVLIGCITMLPFFIADPETMLMFLTYHMDRGMQIESVASSVLMLLGYFDIIDIGYIFNYGSDNIYGAVPDAVAGCMLYLMAASIAATYVAYGSKVRHADKDMFPRFNAACLAVIMLFMLVNKVLSPQYIIWMIPFVTVMIPHLESEWKMRSVIIMGVMIGLTQLNMVFNYVIVGLGEPLTLPGILILIVRNGILVFILVKVMQMILKPGDLVAEHEV